MEATQTENKGTVLIESAEQLTGFNKSEETQMDEMIKSPCGPAVRPRYRSECNYMTLYSTPGACPSPVLGLWGKMTMPDAGTMAYRRDLPSTTRI